MIHHITCLIRIDKDLIWTNICIYRKYTQYQIAIGNRTSKLLVEPRRNTWQGCFVKIYKGKFEINKYAIPRTWFQNRKASRIEGIQF